MYKLILTDKKYFFLSFSIRIYRKNFVPGVILNSIHWCSIW